MSEKESSSLSFHYLKAHDFHTVHADGVFGGVNPRGRVNVAFYSERFPLPKAISHRIDQDGKLDLSEELRRDTIGGIVRDVHVLVDMDYPLAVSFRDWLDEKISQIESSKNTNTTEGEKQ